MKISSLLLKKAAKLGLTLYQIGQVICRPDDDETCPSKLEEIVAEAESVAVKSNKPKLHKVGSNSDLR
jgi:hypothetical protein